MLSPTLGNLTKRVKTIEQRPRKTFAPELRALTIRDGHFAWARRVPSTHGRPSLALLYGSDGPPSLPAELAIATVCVPEPPGFGVCTHDKTSGRKSLSPHLILRSGRKRRRVTGFWFLFNNRPWIAARWEHSRLPPALPGIPCLLRRPRLSRCRAAERWLWSIDRCLSARHTSRDCPALGEFQRAPRQLTCFFDRR